MGPTEPIGLETQESITIEKTGKHRERMEARVGIEQKDVLQTRKLLILRCPKRPRSPRTPGRKHKLAQDFRLTDGHSVDHSLIDSPRNPQCPALRILTDYDARLIFKHPHDCPPGIAEHLCDLGNCVGIVFHKSAFGVGSKPNLGYKNFMQSYQTTGLLSMML